MSHFFACTENCEARDTHVLAWKCHSFGNAEIVKAGPLCLAMGCISHALLSAGAERWTLLEHAVCMSHSREYSPFAFVFSVFLFPCCCSLPLTFSHFALR